MFTKATDITNWGCLRPLNWASKLNTCIGMATNSIVGLDFSSGPYTNYVDRIFDPLSCQHCLCMVLYTNYEKFPVISIWIWLVVLPRYNEPYIGKWPKVRFYRTYIQNHIIPEFSKTARYFCKQQTWYHYILGVGYIWCRIIFYNFSHTFYARYRACAAHL